MDDVAGLVMVQIISNLGSSSDGSFNAVTIVRPICVAIGFAVGIVLVCGIAVKPAVRKLQAGKLSLLPKGKDITQVAFVLHMVTLIGFVTGASYAGTSGLFAAYLAGACISWFDDVVISFQKSSYQTNSSATASCDSRSNIEMSPRGAISSDRVQLSSQESEASTSSSSINAATENTLRWVSGQQTFGLYCKQPLHFILCPFFFVSPLNLHTHFYWTIY